MAELIEVLIQYGALVVFLNVFAEQLGAPIPALPTLIVAGALARDGRLSLTPLVLAALAGSLIADTIWFLLGRRHGRRIVKTLCRISLSPDSCVRETESFFDAWGLRSLTFAKFIPGFSTVAPPLAGASGVGLGSFLLFDLVGVAVWAGSGFATGMLFHRVIDRALLFLENLGYGALVVVGTLLLAVIAVKWRKRRRFYRDLRMARITPGELKEFLSDAVVIDVRTPSARSALPKKIPGALMVTAGELEAGLAEEHAGREIILYCT